MISNNKIRHKCNTNILNIPYILERALRARAVDVLLYKYHPKASHSVESGIFFNFIKEK